jgi:hypothetical protein
MRFQQGFEAAQQIRLSRLLAARRRRSSQSCRAERAAMVSQCITSGSCVASPNGLQGLYAAIDPAAASMFESCK